MTADWCQPLGDAGFICGTRMEEHSRRSEGVKWCFHCRTRCEMWRVVAVPDGESYYGPTVHIECAGCGSHDGDLFPRLDPRVGGRMKAITVRQPWALHIMQSGKDVENRTRNIAGRYRGPIVFAAEHAHRVVSA